MLYQHLETQSKANGWIKGKPSQLKTRKTKNDIQQLKMFRTENPSQLLLNPN